MKKYKVDTTKRFEKALKKCIKRGFDIAKLKTVVSELSSFGTLPQSYHPHKLSGKYDGLWECHIEPDWLLIWKQNDTELVLLLIDTGTHSDLF
jgi:mRNA interferase YafQ